MGWKISPKTAYTAISEDCLRASQNEIVSLLITLVGFDKSLVGVASRGSLVSEFDLTVLY